MTHSFYCGQPGKPGWRGTLVFCPQHSLHWVKIQATALCALLSSIVVKYTNTKIQNTNICKYTNTQMLHWVQCVCPAVFHCDEIYKVIQIQLKNTDVQKEYVQEY